MHIPLNILLNIPIKWQGTGLCTVIQSKHILIEYIPIINIPIKWQGTGLCTVIQSKHILIEYIPIINIPIKWQGTGLWIRAAAGCSA